MILYLSFSITKYFYIHFSFLFEIRYIQIADTILGLRLVAIKKID